MIELIIPVVLFVIFIIGGVWCKCYEDKEWNHGCCPKCHKGFYKSFDMASDGSVGYSCTNCDYTTWQSYNTRIKKT